MNNVSPRSVLAEALARAAFDHQRDVMFSQTMVLCNSISAAAQKIQNAVLGTSADSSQNAMKALYSFRDVLFPELATEKAHKAQNAKRTLEKAHREGGIKIKPIGRGRAGRGRR
jgi:hypothetical protein